MPMYFIYGNPLKKTKKEKKSTVFEVVLIIFIYKTLQHFVFKLQLGFILNAFMRSLSSEIVNPNDSL